MFSKSPICIINDATFLFYHQVNFHPCVNANMQHSIVILRSYVPKPQSMCRTQTCECKLLKMLKNLGVGGWEGCYIVGGIIVMFFDHCHLEIETINLGPLYSRNQGQG
jgi:hypothetical protein